MKLEVKIFHNAGELAFEAAKVLQNTVSQNAMGNRPTYAALSGGNTPKILFQKLAEEFENTVKWDMLHLFWGDERCVPPDDNESNYGMTKNYLLNYINIPAGNIHRIRGEDDPLTEADRIAADINKVAPRSGGLPQFDLIYLGLGEDGHTASLFPGQKLKNISGKICGVARHPDNGQKRISLTSDVINNSRHNIFLVTGSDKADIVYKIMSEKDAGRKFPAARVRAEESLAWYLDEEAASKLKMP